MVCNFTVIYVHAVTAWRHVSRELDTCSIECREAPAIGLNMAASAARGLTEIVLPVLVDFDVVPIELVLASSGPSGSARTEHFGLSWWSRAERTVA